MLYGTLGSQNRRLWRDVGFSGNKIHRVRSVVFTVTIYFTVAVSVLYIHRVNHCRLINTLPFKLRYGIVIHAVILDVIWLLCTAIIFHLRVFFCYNVFHIDWIWFRNAVACCLGV